MTAEMKLYRYLKLRRRIDRKIVLEEKWDLNKSFRNKIDFFLITKKIKPFWLKDDELYSFFNDEIKKFASKNHFIKLQSNITLESVDQCELIPWWFDNLKSYDNELRIYGARLIIQGSFADSKITNYSDVDLVIFYKPFSENVLKIKQEIEIFLLQIDPLQHHGIFMIDVDTFDYYWQMDLPVEVLKKAKCFSDEKYNLDIKGILIEHLGSLNAVKSILSIIQKFLEKDYKLIGLWEWKFFISQLLLLPTLLLGSKGNYIYKRDSFEIVKKLFSDKAWYSIDKASEIRDEWTNSNELTEYKNFRNSVSQKPSKDSMKVFDISSISTANDTQFSNSLKALITESEFIISND